MNIYLLRNTAYVIRWFSKAKRQERKLEGTLVSIEHKNFFRDECHTGLISKQTGWVLTQTHIISKVVLIYH